MITFEKYLSICASDVSSSFATFDDIHRVFHFFCQPCLVENHFTNCYQCQSIVARLIILIARETHSTSIHLFKFVKLHRYQSFNLSKLNKTRRKMLQISLCDYLFIQRLSSTGTHPPLAAGLLQLIGCPINNSIVWELVLTK